MFFKQFLLELDSEIIQTDISVDCSLLQIVSSSLEISWVLCRFFAEVLFETCEQTFVCKISGVHL